MKEICVKMLEGKFESSEITGYKTEKVPTLTTFDVRKFGTYFLKCTGKLNSTNEGMSLNDDIDYVVARTVGIKFKKNRTKSVLSNEKMLFKLLSLYHVPLVKNLGRREIVADFVQFRDEIVQKYDSVIANGIALFENQDLTLIPAFNITAISTSPNQDHFLGHYFKPELQTIFKADKTKLDSALPTLSSLVFKLPMNRYELSICEHRHGFEFDIKTTNSTTSTGHAYRYYYNNTRKLFTVQFNERTTYYRDNEYHSSFSCNNYMNKIVGIDLESKVRTLEASYNAFVDWYNGELEMRKDKYSFNFLMNSLDEEGCLI